LKVKFSVDLCKVIIHNQKQQTMSNTTKAPAETKGKVVETVTHAKRIAEKHPSLMVIVVYQTAKKVGNQ
jgi:hypothetical protein